MTPRAFASWPCIALIASLLGAAASIARAGAPGRPVSLVNPTTPGVVTSYATLVSAGFEWRIDGDDNGNCAVTLEYRKLGDTAWKPAQPMLRVEHGVWTHGEDPGNLLAGSLFFLQPGTSYEARLTLADPDGGADQRVVPFTTRVEPQATALRTRYVVPGSGGGSGSASDPYRGLATADAAAQPGDLFLVQRGVYHEVFAPGHDGTATNPIVIAASISPPSSSIATARPPSISTACGSCIGSTCSSRA
jgi:hypothetical protein